MADPETIAVYNARARDYEALFASDRPGTALSNFIAAIPPSGRVLDLGCGPGRSSRLMARAGLIVEAWDASAEMIALANAHDGVAARQAEFADLTAEAAYHGIWANFSLLHAPRDAMPGHLAAIARALRPGGVFHIGLKQGERTERDSLGRLYTYWEQEPLSALLRQAGLTPGPIRSGVEKGLEGTEASWFSILAHA